MDSESTVLLRVTLREISPKIWRSFQVPKTMNLGDLHHVLQIVMGWNDSHLHSYRLSGVEYGYIDESEKDDWQDETKVNVEDVFKRRDDSLLYVYDFGDDWQHDIEMIGSGEGEDVHCTEGERACPPEDVGGPPGYTRFLQAINDPDDEDYEMMTDWMDTNFDPEAFDRFAINLNLERWARR
jgi:hypothetical protein